MRVFKMLAVIVVMLLVDQGARGQAPERWFRGGVGYGKATPEAQLFGYFLVLESEGVRDELKLTGEQWQRINELAAEIGAALKRPPNNPRQLFEWEPERFTTTRTTLLELLDEPQRARLRGLWIQHQGVHLVLTNEELAAELGLDEEQRRRIARDQQEFDLARDDEARERRFLSGDQRTRARNAAEARVLKVLSTDQLAQLEEIKGAPFEFARADGNWLAEFAARRARSFVQFLPAGTHVRLEYRDGDCHVTILSEEAVQSFRESVKRLDEAVAAAKSEAVDATDESRRNIARPEEAYYGLESPWSVTEIGADFVRLEPLVNLPLHEAVEWIVVPTSTIAYIKSAK